MQMDEYETINFHNTASSLIGA